MEIVINEWFLDWHRPDAHPENQHAVFKFIQWILQADCRLVILRNSPFTQKLNRYRKDFDFECKTRESLKLFFSQILVNPEKCRIIEDVPAISLEAEAILNRPVEPPLTNFESDRYLFESATTTEQKIIITTDQKLIERFNFQEEFQLVTPEAFFEKNHIV